MRPLPALCAALLVSAGAAAAPVPKGAGTPDPTPDLAAALGLVEKAVKAQKWPAEADEKALRDTAAGVLRRALKAADQKDRGLPVDFPKLTKADVVAKFDAGKLDGGFVIAGDARITSATNCAIFATGDVQITGATNCVIVARNVRCTSAAGCTIAAAEFVRLTGADRAPGPDGTRDGDPCVLVAGSWIRTTGMDGAVCHVVKPTGLPAPDEAKFAGNGPHPAVRTTVGKAAVFLNAADEVRATRMDEPTYLPQKAPLVK